MASVSGLSVEEETFVACVNPEEPNEARPKINFLSQIADWYHQQRKGNECLRNANTLNPCIYRVKQSYPVTSRVKSVNLSRKGRH